VPFILLNWFISQEKIDNKFHCPLYKLQNPLDYTWRRIYAVKWIDHQPNVHFIHYCNTSCVNGKHSPDNMYYIHNVFYYLAV
jgi:hypothetical protein